MLLEDIEYSNEDYFVKRYSLDAENILAYKQERLEKDVYVYRGLVSGKICKKIFERFGDTRNAEFVFALVSHVIGGGQLEVLAHTGLLKLLPGALKNDTERANVVRQTDFLLSCSDWQFGTEHQNRARTFSLTPEARELMRDEIVFETWGKFTQRKPFQSKPRKFKESSFTARIRECNTDVKYSREFLAALARLSARYLIFDRKSAQADPNVRVCK